jgi:hypothetical protein
VTAGAREALVSERDYLFGSLADLEREHAAGDIDDRDYETLRAGYVARAADLLRQLQLLEQPAGAGGPHASGRHRAARRGAGEPRRTGRRRHAGSRAPRPRLARLRRRLGRRRTRRVLVGLSCACFAALATVVALALAGVRLPGQTPTGTVSEPQSVQIGQDLDEASVLGSSGDIVQAVQAYEQVLDLDPRQPQALAYLGWLDRLTGRSRSDATLVRAGDSLIARAVAADPGYPDARAFDGIALLQDRHDDAAGISELRAFLRDGPSSSLLDALGPSLVTTFRDARAPVPAALRRFERPRASRS